MRQHNKSKTNNVKTRPDAPTKHQAVIQERLTQAKARQAAEAAADAAYKARRAAFMAPPPPPPTGYEEFVDRPPAKKRAVVNRSRARLDKYANDDTD
jgi:hypothetical protein